MTSDEARKRLIGCWLALADEALDSARSEAQAGSGRFALNRAYYACFYAASALLLRDGVRFTKHAGVRSAVHRDLVNTGRLERDFGETYDRLFAARQEAD